MYTIKITTKKKEKMTEHAEKALKHVGKLMQCLEELDEEGMDERYGNRMGERDDWDEDEDERMPQRMGERRRRSSSGRYM